MPKRLRRNLQGTAFHVMNRAVRRTTIFETDEDYEAFVRVICESLQKFKIKVIAYCLMPNHWHLVILCDCVKEMSAWMHWAEGTHANRWNGAHNTRGRGAVYQGRFKAVPIQTDHSLVRVCRYVERNASRGGLVDTAEAWNWSSVHSFVQNCDSAIPLSPWPISRPPDWGKFVNANEDATELADLRRALRRNWPIGTPAWRAAVAPFAGLTFRKRGRPRRR